MTRAALYLRVSSDRQAKEGDSIPAQREALREYAASHHMRIYREYVDDGISGTKYSQRDELQALLDDVRAGHIDIILFTKLDRWFRSVRHYTRTQEILDKHGVPWLAIWEPVYDVSTPQGKLIIHQMMSIAEFEAANTGERVRAIFEHKVQNGEVLSGCQPYGYKIVDKRLVPDEHAGYVGEIFERYSLTGNLCDVTRFASGFPGAPHVNSSIKRILKNTKYIGLYRGNPHYCEPLVSEDLFYDVQRKLGMNIKKSQKNTYIFSGILCCAECGRKLGSYRTRGLTKYRCQKYYSRGVRTCTNKKAIREETLEAYLLARIRPEMEKKIEDYEIAEKDRDSAEKRKQNIEKKLSRLKDLYLDGLIEINEYRADRERLEAELSDIIDTPKKDFAEIRDLLDHTIGEIYETFSPEEKRFFWRAVVKEIKFGADKSIGIVFND